MPTPPISSIESESRTWGMLAHLCIFAHFFVPFGGLIATILIYTIRKDDAIARENQRNALNFEITLAILGLIFAIVYLIGFFLLFFSSAAAHSAHAGSNEPPPTFLFVWLGSIFVFFLVSIGAMITAGFGARTAWLGRVFTYPLAIEFVR